jgi:hypothetical protein
MNKSRYELVVLDEVEGNLIAKMLGGCNSPAQATVMLNAAYAEQRLARPTKALLVPGSNVFPCKAIQTYQLEAVVSRAPQDQTNAAQA